MRAQLDEESVIKANGQFWEQMLAMTLEPMPRAGEFSVSAGHLWGGVGLSGAWQGRIEVRLTGALAYEATAAMMMQSLDTVGEADALDATKEIANMIAGTIKSSLPRPCSMTVPNSSVEQQPFSAPAESLSTLTVAFRHASGQLMVRISEQDCVAS